MRHTPPPWFGEATSERTLWLRVHEAPRSVLMLDYDGTLAPFHADRTQAFMYPGVEERVAVLASLPRVRLVLVSGRPARELLALLRSGSSPEIWGSHGREQLTRDGGYRVFSADQAQLGALHDLHEALKQQGFEDALEVKPASLAVHWRNLDVPQRTALGELAKQLYRPYSRRARLELLPFDGGVEYRAVGFSKGTALKRILAAESPDTPAAYLGDDETDEDAFCALAERGPSMLVRREPRGSNARFWLNPPEELRRFLDCWIDAAGMDAARTDAGRIDAARIDAARVNAVLESAAPAEDSSVTRQR